MTPSPNESVLVIAAHPDDEVLGCGASIARMAAEGAKVRVAILGEGLTARGREGEDAHAGTERLRNQARLAAARLGAAGVHFGGLPDNRLDELPLLEVVRIVEGIVATVRPSLVLTHHPGDLNVDHGITFRATLTAVRPMPASHVRALRTFEVLSSSEWSFGKVGAPFAPDTFVDVDAYLDAKVAAMEEYEGELREFPHPRSREGIVYAARRWGTVVGYRAAEAFETIFDRR